MMHPADCTLHEKAAILYPDSYGLLSRGWHKQLHELEELLRSAQELLKDLAEPLHLFTHATERFKELRAKMTECLNLMTILLLFVPPDHMVFILGLPFIHMAHCPFQNAL